MWIRSQDGKQLIEVNHITASMYYISCGKCTLGEYNEDRVTEVMDMIQDHLNDFKQGYREVFEMPKE